MASNEGDADMQNLGTTSVTVESVGKEARSPDSTSAFLGTASVLSKTGDGMKKLEKRLTSPSIDSPSTAEDEDEDEVEENDSDPNDSIASIYDDPGYEPGLDGRQSEDDSEVNGSSTKKHRVKVKAAAAAKATTAKGEKAKSKGKPGKKKIGTVRVDTTKPEEVQKRVQQDHKKIYNLQYHKKQFKKQLDAANEKNTILVREKGELQEKLKEKKAALEKICRERLGLLSRERVEVTPDSIVTTTLSSIFRGSKSWSKAWGKKEWTDDSIVKARDVIAQLNEAKSVPFATALLALAITRGKTPPSVVLNAFLNHALCTAIFERQFAHLSQIPGGESGGNVEECLNRIMDLAKKKSRTAFNKLRASILRTIDDSAMEEDEGSAVDELAQDMQRWRHDRACVLVDRYLELLKVFLKDLKEQTEVKCRTQLSRTVESALRCSSVLATENPELKISFLNDLPEDTFGMEDKSFDPHPALQLREAKLIENDEDSDGYDDPTMLGLIGQPVDMLVEPLVIRFGNKAGENYDGTGKLLHRGVAWMVKDKDLRFARAAEPGNIAKLHAPEGPSPQGELHASKKSLKRDQDAEKAMPKSAKKVSKEAESEIEPAISMTLSPSPYKLRPHRAPSQKKVEMEQPNIARRKSTSRISSSPEGTAMKMPASNSKKPQPASASNPAGWRDDLEPVMSPDLQRQQAPVAELTWSKAVAKLPDCARGRFKQESEDPPNKDSGQATTKASASKSEAESVQPGNESSHGMHIYETLALKSESAEQAEAAEAISEISSTAFPSSEPLQQSPEKRKLATDDEESPGKESEATDDEQAHKKQRRFPPGEVEDDGETSIFEPVDLVGMLEEGGNMDDDMTEDAFNGFPDLQDGIQTPPTNKQTATELVHASSIEESDTSTIAPEDSEPADLNAQPNNTTSLDVEVAEGQDASFPTSPEVQGESRSVDTIFDQLDPDLFKTEASAGGQA